MKREINLYRCITRILLNLQFNIFILNTTSFKRGNVFEFLGIYFTIYTMRSKTISFPSKLSLRGF